RNENAVSSAGINLLRALVSTRPCTKNLAYYVGMNPGYSDDKSGFSRITEFTRSKRNYYSGCRIASYVL
ncbi:MAG: hypothetical protein SOW38_05895, partial [Succinivibrio sp.]|nr:hypothetical protein [Succinivibrio sp.]